MSSQQIVVDPGKYESLPFVKVVEFVSGGIKVRFTPLSKRLPAPGYSHRIQVYREQELLGSDWLPNDQQPTQKNAEFFYNKIVNHVYKH